MTVAGIDLGKTGCRIVLDDTVLSGPGAPGLAQPDGVAAALAAIRATWPTGTGAVRRAVVGAAGAIAAPAAAKELAGALRDEFGIADVRVTSDAVIAHAGALSGHPGTVLAIGTGAVATRVDEDGQLTVFDGWGPWLGDDGSGAWIGRAAIRLALASREAGSGGAEELTRLVVDRFGDLTGLPSRLSGDEATPRQAATLAPGVLDLAARGDEAAADIVDRAAQSLAATVRRTGAHEVAVTGGLAASEVLLDQLRRHTGARIELADGTALDGAVLLAAARTNAPHHQLLVSAPTDSAAPSSVDSLGTEQVRSDLADLDLRSPAELVDVMLAAEARVPAVMARAKPQLARVVELAAAALRAGGRIVYVGAGTPGRLGALDAAECPPTFGVSPHRVVGLLAGGPTAMSKAVEGAEDDRSLGRRDIADLGVGPDDLVVGIAASGRTPYVVAALEHAAERGARTAAIVNNSGSAVARAAQVPVELVIGPEVVSGSTRLTAGTSQKIALNIVSTCAWVLNGKTYGAWMVDVQATNDKLRQRANRIVREITGADEAKAAEALLATDWHVKPAIVMVQLGVGPAEAATALQRADGHVRRALESDSHPGADVGGQTSES